MKKKEYIIKGFNVHTHDLEYYLEKHSMCHLNTRIYNKYKEHGGLAFDIEQAFNEAYYTATRIYHDKYPSNNFYKKYDFAIDNGKAFGDEYFKPTWWITYFVIHHANQCEYKRNLMDFICCFCSTWLYNEPIPRDPFGEPVIETEKDWISEIDVFQGFDTIEEWSPTLEECRNVDLEPFDFALDTPITPDDVTDSEWKSFTHDYNHDYIRFIVAAYIDRHDAETALNNIRAANFSEYENLPCDYSDSLDDFYNRIKITIDKKYEASKQGVITSDSLQERYHGINIYDYVELAASIRHKYDGDYIITDEYPEGGCNPTDEGMEHARHMWANVYKELMPYEKHIYEDYNIIKLKSGINLNIDASIRAMYDICEAYHKIVEPYNRFNALLHAPSSDSKVNEKIQQLEQELAEARKIIEEQQVRIEQLQNKVSKIPANQITALALAMQAKGQYKYSSRADFIHDAKKKHPEFSSFSEKTLLGAMNDLLQNNTTGDFTTMINDQGSMKAFIEGCYTKTKRNKESTACTIMKKKADDYYLNCKTLPTKDIRLHPTVSEH